eukprot:snap_masked-scaffold_21-processed-gene-5.77-mRNA-1 protein AED:1.00 eAED:1.00 QI:0/0/0/0/1/1/2/0/285
MEKPKVYIAPKFTKNEKEKNNNPSSTCQSSIHQSVRDSVATNGESVIRGGLNSLKIAAFPPTLRFSYSSHLHNSRATVDTYTNNLEREKALSKYMKTPAAQDYQLLGLPIPEFIPKQSRKKKVSYYDRDFPNSFGSSRTISLDYDVAERISKQRKGLRRMKFLLFGIFFLVNPDENNQEENKKDLEDDFEIPEVENLAAICAQVDFDLDGDNAFCISDTLWVRCVDGQIDPDEEDAEVRNCVNSPGTGLCPCALNIVVEDSFPCGEDDVSNDSINCDPVVLIETL